MIHSNARTYRPTSGLIAIGSVLVLFLIVSFVSYTRVLASFGLVLRQVDTSVAIRDERRLFLDSETGIRGFAATGERLFLQPYNDAQTNLPATSARVRALLKVQGLTDALQLQESVIVRQGVWDETVARKLLAAPHDPRATAWQESGKALMDASRADFDRMLTIVRNHRLQTASETKKFIQYLLAGSVLLTMVLTAIGIVLEAARARVQARLTAALESQASHDSMTGLLNRRKFEELLDREVSEAKRYDEVVAVLFLDLDGFKEVNDTLGHQAGDSVLKTVATRLNDSLRETDAVCRLGGDEFVMMLPTIHDIGEVVHVAEKLISSVAQPIPIGNGTTAAVTASIGISTLSPVHTSSSSLITAADEAMFASKRLGKNRYALAP